MDPARTTATAHLRIRWLSAAVAALLGLITLMIAVRGVPTIPATIAFGGATAAFAIILVCSLAALDDVLVGGAAVGIAAATRWIVAVLVALGVVAPIAMLLLWHPFLLLPTIAVVTVATLLGGAGSLLVFAVFVLQFPLAAEGRRLAPPGSDRGGFGKVLGWVLGIAPLFIAIATGSSLENARSATAVQHSRDESRARFAEWAADSARQVHRAEREPRRVLMQLHACVHRGCVDSLLLAEARDSVIVRYNPLSGHRYWAWAQAGRGPYARRFVTDQTGTLFEWPIPPAGYDHPAPDSADILQVADTTAREMSALGDCVWYQYQLDMAPVPPHVTQVCALSGDTSRVRMANGTDYSVAFLYIKPTRSNPRGDFALSARPAIYGRNDVRSFFIRNEGKDVRVTTEDRAARATDQRVDEFEYRTGRPRIATH